MGGGTLRATTAALHAPIAHPRPTPPPPRPPTVIPAPPTVIPAQAGTRAPPPSFLRRQEPAQAGTHHHHPTSPIPNSSLPPSRGEVRWGVECCEPPPRPYTPRSPTRAPLRHSCAPTVIPAQAGTHAPPAIPAPHSATPTPLPSSPRSSRHSRAPPVIPAPSPRHSCVLPTVIPAQAGTTPHPHFPQILLHSHQNRSAKPCPSPRKAAPPDPTPPPATTHSPTLTKP